MNNQRVARVRPQTAPGVGHSQKSPGCAALIRATRLSPLSPCGRGVGGEGSGVGHGCVVCAHTTLARRCAPPAPVKGEGNPGRVVKRVVFGANGSAFRVRQLDVRSWLLDGPTKSPGVPGSTTRRPGQIARRSGFDNSTPGANRSAFRVRQLGAPGKSLGVSGSTTRRSELVARRPDQIARRSGFDNSTFGAGFSTARANRPAFRVQQLDARGKSLGAAPSPGATRHPLPSRERGNSTRHPIPSRERGNSTRHPIPSRERGMHAVCTT